MIAYSLVGDKVDISQDLFTAPFLICASELHLIDEFHECRYRHRDACGALAVDAVCSLVALSIVIEIIE